MAKLIILFALFPLLTQAATVSIKAAYREPANIFVIMDCVSGWWDQTYCYDDGAYLKEWKKRYGIAPEDDALFKKYDEVRRRYFKGLGLPRDPTEKYSDGIFAKKASISDDMLAPLFYASEKMEDALKSVKAKVTEEDYAFLVEFYEHFKPKYAKMLEESKVFKAKAKALNHVLANKKYADFFARISKYYSVTETLNYQVLFVWFPPSIKDMASPTDQFLILNQDPAHLDTQDEDVVFHEIVHTLSARQPQKQKEAVSDAFLDQCPIEDLFEKGKRGRILEEPMAVTIGQILFLEEFFPSRLKWDSKLYNHYWVSSFAKMIFPVIKADFKEKKTFSDETGKKLGFLCDEMLKASDLLKISKDQRQLPREPEPAPAALSEPTVE